MRGLGFCGVGGSRYDGGLGGRSYLMFRSFGCFDVRYLSLSPLVRRLACWGIDGFGLCWLGLVGLLFFLLVSF
jgi:hypothetical protein